MKSDGFNPLLRLPDKSSPGFNVEASKLAETLAPIEATGDNKHFDESAQIVLAAYIMAELVEAREAGRQPSFERLRENLAKPANEYCIGLKDNPAMPMAVKNKVADLDVGSDSKSLQSVMMTLRTKTALLDDGYILDDLATKSAFRFADMRQEITTVYIVIPADDTARVEKWMRLVVMSALRDLQKADANPKLGPVLFLLDEYPLLGKFKPVEDAMAYARGYGIQLWPVVQNLGQLKALYGENWETFISNVDVLTSFTARDNLTAEYLSKRAGDRTVVQHGQNVGEGARGESTGQSETETGVPLFRPEELGRLGFLRSLNFVRGVDFPFITHCSLYGETEFAEGLDEPPRPVMG
jgi:type IV secretion system protein VirD4